jgi:acyl carrier protein
MPLRVSNPPTCNPSHRLYRTVADTLGVDIATLCESSSPATIDEWDSLSHLQLVMAIESEFGVRLAPDDVLRIRDLASMRTILAERGADGIP